MAKFKKRLLTFTALVIIIAGAIVLIIRFMDPMGGFLIYAVFWYDPYKYNSYCSPNGEKCLTVISHTPGKFVDSVTKRYIVFGKKRFKIPIKADYIEFPEETGVVILWESDAKCKVISDDAPMRIMQLSVDVSIEIISDNVLFHQYAKNYPNLRVGFVPKSHD